MKLTPRQLELVEGHLFIAELEAARAFDRKSRVEWGDLLAAAYWGLCQGAISFKGGKFPAYARIACRHQIWTDRTRLLNSRAGTKLLLYGELEDRSGSPHDPLEAVIRRENAANLHRAILRLTPLQRRVIHGRLAGRSPKAMRTELGISHAAIMQVLQRARQSIRKQLGG